MACCSVTLLIALACPGDDGANEPKKYMEFSFDQVEVRYFVKVVGEVTGKRIVVDQKVEGKITVVSPRIPTDQAFRVFVSILESVGCSVVEEEDGSYRVVAIGTRTTHPTRVIGPDEKTPILGVVTKVFRLQYVRAAEMRKVLEAKVGGGKEGAVAAIDSTNHLIVTDTAENIRRIEKIINEVDRSDLSSTTDVIPLKFANAEDMEQQLTRAMSLGSAARTRTYQRYLKSADLKTLAASRRDLVIVAAPHSNSLIVVGPTSQVQGVKKLISLMDVDSPSGRGRLSVIFLKYISAQDAAKSINALLVKKIQKTPRAVRQQAKISIEPHIPNNALLVDAMPRDFELVQNLVKELDQPPQQVAIDVLIVEVSLRDELDVGVGFMALGIPSEVGSLTVQGGLLVKEDAAQVMSAVQAGLFPQGISVGLAHGIREDASGKVISSIPGLLNIDAIRKSGKFNILSKVRLQAQNNKEAFVNIVNNIPILKSTISGGTGSARDIIQNIERIDVGIKLKLTPHINPNGEVTLDLNTSIEAIIDPGSIAGKLAPTIARREISTTVTVADGDTVVLSGLIREDKVETVRKVPILGSIPLIGWLFRHRVEGKEKTDLLVFVTPYLGTHREGPRDLSKMPSTDAAILGPPVLQGTDRDNSTTK